MQKKVGTLAIVQLVFACSSSPQLAPEEESTSFGQAMTVTNQAAQTPNAARKRGRAFVHDLGKSRFSPGAFLNRTNAAEAYRIEGSDGVFAHFQSGLAIASSNATAAVRSHGGPPPGGASAHNQAVRKYLVEAGLPEDQIRGVDVYPVVTAVLRNGDAAVASEKPKLEYYTTMISRQIAGIPVDESYAWARLNQDGAVVSESVYWPEIPESVIEEGVSLAAKTADNAAGSDFRQRLPSKHRKKVGTITIHHTPGEWPKGFAAVAAYDVLDEAVEMPSTVHYDANPARILLPHEAADAWGPISKSNRKLPIQ